MRHIKEEMMPFSGEIGAGRRLSVSLPSNAVYRSFYLETNIDAQYIEAIELANGSDTPLGFSAPEIIMIEKHNKREIVNEMIPFHVADITAKTLPGQDSLERVSGARDAHELRIRFSSALPAADDYYMKSYASYASFHEVKRDEIGKVVLGSDSMPILSERVRVNERRTERHTINNVNKGQIVFDKLSLGSQLRVLYIKGDVSKVEIECLRGSNVVKRLEIDKKVNEFIQRTEHNLEPQDGYFILNFVGSGFMSDAMGTNYDSVRFKIQHESDSASIDILADVNVRV